MKRIQVLLYTAALFGLMAGTAAAWAQSDQPALGDVARQKSAAKAKRVVTNDEIPPSPEANNLPASAAAASPSSDDSVPSGKGNANKVQGKAADSDKQTKLQGLMKENDTLRKIVKQMEEKIDASDDQNRIATLSEVLQHAKDALAENQQQMDTLKASGAAAGQGGGTQPADNQPAADPQTPPPPK